jgi:parvulin-like peptidyl-prolyl isomerase
MLKFNKGLPFNEVAMKYSEDKETAKKCGSLEGWITESNGLIEEIAIHGFYENVLGLGEKDISRPFLFHGSYYIVQVRERQEPIPMAYADARDAIELELKARKHVELTTKIEETMIDGAKLVIFDEVIETILKKKNKEEEGAPE